MICAVHVSTIVLSLLQVPPKSSVRVSVSFKAQCLTECEATLLLIPKGGGGRQGYPLSFKLTGQVNAVHPKVLQFTCACLLHYYYYFV